MWRNYHSPLLKYLLFAVSTRLSLFRLSNLFRLIFQFSDNFTKQVLLHHFKSTKNRSLHPKMYPSSSIKVKITIATLLASAGDVEAHGYQTGPRREFLLCLIMLRVFLYIVFNQSFSLSRLLCAEICSRRFFGG